MDTESRLERHVKRSVVKKVDISEKFLQQKRELQEEVERRQKARLTKSIQVIEVEQKGLR